MFLPFEKEPAEKQDKAPRNKTLVLSDSEKTYLLKKTITIAKPIEKLSEIINKTVLGDCFKILDLLPEKFIDLIFVDPPYNLTKTFNNNAFRMKSDGEYIEWLELWLPKLKRLIKPAGSLYICGDWRSSPLIYSVGKKQFIPRNRITWEREKGRGAKKNWKNCSEDIWFFTNSVEYTFHIERVKVQRKVIAPYVDGNGKPKDWIQSKNGNYRITHPSNLWNDLTIPFWSMPENTDHSTQKPEKLLAKIILASSNENDLIFDPFLGSGTTSVVSKKLKRNYLGIEIDEKYCALAEKRLEMAENNKTIQGFIDGIFWERNSLP